MALGGFHGSSEYDNGFALVGASLRFLQQGKFLHFIVAPVQVLGPDREQPGKHAVFTVLFKTLWEDGHQYWYMGYTLIWGQKDRGQVCCPIHQLVAFCICHTDADYMGLGARTEDFKYPSQDHCQILP